MSSLSDPGLYQSCNKKTSVRKHLLISTLHDDHHRGELHKGQWVDPVILYGQKGTPTISQRIGGVFCRCIEENLGNTWIKRIGFKSKWRMTSHSKKNLCNSWIYNPLSTNHHGSFLGASKNCTRNHTWGHNEFAMEKTLELNKTSTGKASRLTASATCPCTSNKITL